jgi:hypothetical protein
VLTISRVVALAEGTPPAGAQRRSSANVLVEPKGSYGIASPIAYVRLSQKRSSANVLLEPAGAFASP